MAVLAALILTVTGALKRKAILSRVQAEQAQVQTAIESYKSKLGFYPPDNPGNPVVNQLYFELSGTVMNGAAYQTLDGSADIPANRALKDFGAGFMNVTRGAGGDEGAVAVNFLKGARSDQGVIAPVDASAPRLKLLAVSLPWPQNLPPPSPGAPGLNPWRYVSSNPTNNPNSYDLWVDIVIARKKYRISNWSKTPEIVP